MPQMACKMCGNTFHIPPSELKPRGNFCSRACSYAGRGSNYPELRVRFDRQYIPEPNSGCWLWTGAVGSRAQYPTLARPSIRDRGRNRSASRVSWELHHGPIPGGLFVLHTCDVPTCVNPDHLFLGTNTDNMQDMKIKGRAHAAKGEANGRAKLTANEVLAIRSSTDSGKFLARRFAVSETTISRARSGKRWGVEVIADLLKIDDRLSELRRETTP